MKGPQILRLITILSLIAGAIGFSSMSSGCKREAGGARAQGTATVTAGARKISASIDALVGMYPDIDPTRISAGSTGVSFAGPIAIFPEGDSAIVRFGTHNLRIEKQQLRWEGVAVTDLPASATSIDVIVSNATMTVSVDGRNFFQWRELVK